MCKSETQDAVITIRFRFVTWKIRHIVLRTIHRQAFDSKLFHIDAEPLLCIMVYVIDRSTSGSNANGSIEEKTDSKNSSLFFTCSTLVKYLLWLLQVKSLPSWPSFNCLLQARLKTLALVFHLHLQAHAIDVIYVSGLICAIFF